MAIGDNTGNKVVLTLKKVVDGGPHDGEPLDENGNLCSESSLPQATKPNSDTDPDYIAPYADLTSCPLPSGGSIQIEARYHTSTEGICSIAPQTVYISDEYTDIGINVVVYTDSALTTVLTGYNFITNSVDEIWEINNATGTIGDYTSTNCTGG